MITAPAIRPLEAADVPSVVAVGRDLLPGSWPDASLADEVTRAGSSSWGIFRDGALVGFALLRVLDQEAELMLIGVATSERRRGHASALWAAVEADLARIGVISVFLEVRTTNEPARALYEARGFTEVGTRRAYYRDTGEDAVVMRRRIGPSADARPAHSG